MNSKNYFAFISYKREGIDEKVANWIHSKLEKYPYPKEMVLAENRPEDPDRIRKVFIDTKELPVTDKHFGSKINECIRNSRYLIVVCSPIAVQSEFVSKEVEYFLQTHDNDTTKVLPVFIDSVDENFLPDILRGKDLLDRNCPIYKSIFEPKNEINQYCFYHIVSFLLKVDFNAVYDRYQLYAQKKNREQKILRRVFYLMLMAIIVFLSIVAIERMALVRKQTEIVQLEKEIFPYSVVTGYVGNFLSPVVDYIKEKEQDSHVYVYMPTSSKDLNENHRNRFKFTASNIASVLQIDSLEQVTLETRMPRGSRLHKMQASSDNKFHGKYIDFASTTSTFLAIAEMKANKTAYADIPIDSMIVEYTDIFIKQANDMLGPDAVYVTFVKSIEEMK